MLHYLLVTRSIKNANFTEEFQSLTQTPVDLKNFLTETKFHLITSLIYGKPQGGSSLQSFIRGGSAPKPSPLPLWILFWQKRYAFCAEKWKMVQEMVVPRHILWEWQKGNLVIFMWGCSHEMHLLEVFYPKSPWNN